MVINNTLEDKNSEYRKLIKEKGLSEALRIMKSSGGLFEEGFIENEKKNPLFTKEEVAEFGAHLKEIPKEIVLDLQTPPSDWLIPSAQTTQFDMEGQLKRVQQDGDVRDFLLQIMNKS